MTCHGCSFSWRVSLHLQTWMRWNERWCEFRIPTLRRQVGTWGSSETTERWERCICEVGSGILLSLYSARGRHSSVDKLTQHKSTSGDHPETNSRLLLQITPTCFLNVLGPDHERIPTFLKPGFPRPSARSKAFHGVQRAPGEVRHFFSIVYFWGHKKMSTTLSTEMQYFHLRRRVTPNRCVVEQTPRVWRL